MPALQLCRALLRFGVVLGDSQIARRFGFAPADLAIAKALAFRESCRHGHGLWSRLFRYQQLREP